MTTCLSRNDDRSIPDDERLLRRIPKSWYRLDDTGRVRISSAAFKHYEMSVYLASVVTQTGRKSKDLLSNYPNYGLASVTAAVVRELDQIVLRDSTRKEPAHALVVGKKTRSVARRIRNKCEWIIKPNSVPYL